MKIDIFISYRSLYVNVVKAIVHLLEDEGIRCWYAPRDLDNRGVGLDYDDEIVNAINSCKAVIVILNDEALKSEWVKSEINHAQNKKKIIFPYVINELTIENGLLFRLNCKHWIDAFPNPERKFSLLLNNVKLLLNQTLNENDDTPRYEITTESDYDNDFDYEDGTVLYEAKEYGEAVLALLPSAERGNPKAQQLLCKIFYDNPSQINDFPDEIWSTVDNLAKANFCYANFIMHCKYYKDPTNYYLSFEYLKKAIRKNDIPYAFVRIGIFYEDGLGVKQNHTLALHYYEKAAGMNCIEAYAFLGQFYILGVKNIPINHAKALEYFTKGTEKGDYNSINGLVYYYRVVDKNYELAKKWAQKAIDLGFDAGYCWMGDIYADMDDTTEQETAIKWYKEAALRDVKEAYSRLAFHYWKKNTLKEAYKYAHKGELENDHGSIYLLGLFHEKNEEYDIAWQYYYKRYELFGNSAEDLGRLYLEHDFLPEKFTIEQLISILEIAIGGNNEKALEQLITIYSDKKYGLADDNKLVNLYKLGAQQGNTLYMYKYGLALFHGNGKNFNPYKGLTWIEKAAQAENQEAIDKLLDIYLNTEYKDFDKLLLLNTHLIKNQNYTSTVLSFNVSKKIDICDSEYLYYFKPYLIKFIEDNNLIEGIHNETEALVIWKLLYNYYKKRWDFSISDLEKYRSCISKSEYKYIFLDLKEVH